jgi:CDGSH-type Zn-finger protein
MTKLEIKARENGPYKFPGTYTYIDEKGQIQKTERGAMALCRCGQSASKPFCDGSHKAIGFSAPLVFLSLDPDA